MSYLNPNVVELRRPNGPKALSLCEFRSFSAPRGGLHPQCIPAIRGYLLGSWPPASWHGIACAELFATVGFMLNQLIIAKLLLLESVIAVLDVLVILTR